MVALNKRVLVVDDEPIVCESYERVLCEEGYAVTTAATGRDALEACHHTSFDVVLADLKMPDMDGLEITKRVKEQFPQVQVVIITGYPTAQSANQAQQLGVFQYLPKPLTPDQLSSITAAALAFPARGVMPATMEPPAETDAPLATSAPLSEAETSSTPSLDAAAPAVPDEAVVCESAAISTERDESSEAPMPTLTRREKWKVVGLLTLAPAVGLGYILILPILGFGAFLGVLGISLPKKLVSLKKTA